MSVCSRLPQCDSLPQCHASGELKEVGCRSVDGGGGGGGGGGVVGRIGCFRCWLLPIRWGPASV